MPKFKVMTRETVYRVYIYEADDMDDAIEQGVEGLDGKEVDYDFETVSIEPITDEVTP